MAIDFAPLAPAEAIERACASAIHPASEPANQSVSECERDRERTTHEIIIKIQWCELCLCGEAIRKYTYSNEPVTH